MGVVLYLEAFQNENLARDRWIDFQRICKGYAAAMHFFLG